MNIQALSAEQLRRAASIKEEIDTLQNRLNGLLVSQTSSVPRVYRKRKKRTMSAAGRAKIAAAQRARWAKFHAKRKGA